MIATDRLAVAAVITVVAVAAPCVALASQSPGPLLHPSLELHPDFPCDLGPPPQRGGSGDWENVRELGKGAMLRVTLADRVLLASEDGRSAIAEGTMTGVLVTTSTDRLLLKIDKGDRHGSWWIHRNAVRSVVTGRRVTDPPWEGILGGLGVAVGTGALLGLAAGEGDLGGLQIGLAVGTIVFAPPAILIGGLADHFYRSFEPTATVYASLGDRCSAPR